MKISGSVGPNVPVAPAVSESAPVDPVPATVAGASSAGEPLQSAMLQQAQSALAGLPDIDHAKVAALRDALAKGELPFDAAKLAGLIDRYHGSKP